MNVYQNKSLPRENLIVVNPLASVDVTNLVTRTVS